jgi:hypothetical protein
MMLFVGWWYGQDFDKARAEYADQLSADLLIKHHIHILYEQLLEANLVRVGSDSSPRCCIPLLSQLTMACAYVRRNCRVHPL